MGSLLRGDYASAAVYSQLSVGILGNWFRTRQDSARFTAPVRLVDDTTRRRACRQGPTLRRGLEIVEELAGSWVVHEGTTHVRFELERPAPRPGEPERPADV